MKSSQITTRDVIPVHDYVREPPTPLSSLPHGWELHAALLLTPAEERTMVREPADAVPEPLAARLGKLRVLAVPYVGCFEAGDAVCFAKPAGETHTAVWLEAEGRTHLILACREVDAHDTGFEFLASVAQISLPKLAPQDLAKYARLLEEELRQSVSGEIDKEALAAKESYLKFGSSAAAKTAQFEKYRDVSLASTLAEYMHGLWHDVQIRVGPEHLPVEQLRLRMMSLAEIFPPNPGYNLFARDIESTP
ncbi:MAG TPA: hypothetical protein VKV79_03380 [Terriglobia bacterium]|nr:hypothetical protein [Terriglobia bacterium]